MARDTSPQFDMTINGYDIGPELLRMVQAIEYDSGDGLADQLKIDLSNVDFAVAKTKMFRVGNIVKVWAGYGAERTFIGGARITEVNTDYPDNGMPKMEVVGYTGDWLMTKNAPAPRAEGKPFRRKPRRARANDGRAWFEGAMYSDAIRDKARAYGFRADVDDTPENIIGPNGVFQPADMTDFKFASLVSNELRWLFWVSADEDTETWVLHFKDPNTTAGIQDRKLDFKYNRGNQSSIFGFRVTEYDQGPTSLQVQFVNPKTKRLETVSVEVDPTLVDSPKYLGIPGEEPLLRLPSNPPSGPQITVAFGGGSVVTQADRQFGSVAEAKAWARAWFAEHESNFIRAEWKTKGPGSETLTARQVHSVSGVGSRHAGDYYLTNVTHQWSASSGHVVTCRGRMISGADE